jgi:hypothetical protein
VEHLTVGWPPGPEINGVIAQGDLHYALVNLQRAEG